MSLPQPLAVNAQTTFDPASRSLLVRVTGLGGAFWRKGHAKLLEAETPGNVFEFSHAAPPVCAEGARGEPVSDGWLRFKLPDATYQLAGADLAATAVVDQAGGQILGVRFKNRNRS